MATDPGREITLQAGDETYTLYAGNRALRMIERETGKPILEALTALGDQSTADINSLTIIVWALLQRHHKELTVEDVDDVIDDAGGWAAIMDPLSDAIGKAFPTVSDDDSGKARRGTGKRSLSAVSRAA